MRFLGILFVIGGLALGTAVLFGLINVDGHAALTQQGEQTLQSGVDSAKGAAVDALDSLSNKIKQRPN
jgi:hypothetical protein